MIIDSIFVFCIIWSSSWVGLRDVPEPLQADGLWQGRDDLRHWPINFGMHCYCVDLAGHGGGARRQAVGNNACADCCHVGNAAGLAIAGSQMGTIVYFEGAGPGTLQDCIAFAFIRRVRGHDLGIAQSAELSHRLST
ncbi:hypothetical protein [Noviherbaspirillum agri]